MITLSALMLLPVALSAPPILHAALLAALFL